MNMKLMVSAKYSPRTFLIRSPSPLVNKRRAIVHKKCSQQPVIGKGKDYTIYLSDKLISLPSSMKRYREGLGGGGFENCCYCSIIEN